ncbi:transcription antitermination factor NusB [Candidatus Roizmanbacteria bacterium RIFCSPHIGHO2_12_FULL_44_10]|uniref:Transcription antitermination factor NusB n=1 Tax=Candidatus Roizmanbacteria bacterium RIFCSPHIGHO2_12_FULL_44_10 TaxID=1802054 RepID=A0A1F7I7H5_9BACT|nr:MAG: transcription antitermination factor NusB [Candidatus Roizmanbacteria bacterium RIFCSPHIGHO2_12_FULL_44_10]
MDIRHERRLKVVQHLFAAMYDSPVRRNVNSEKVKEVLAHKESLDKHVEAVAQKYTADKIARVDLCILRLALYELLIEKKVPPKVIINEAVELGKELGSEKSPSFINAVLGKIYETERNKV